MRSHRAVTMFILVRLHSTYSLRFCFQFSIFTYMLSMFENLTLNFFILVDFSLNSYAFFLQIFLLEILFTTDCVSKFLYSISSIHKTNNLRSVSVKYFLFCFVALLGGTYVISWPLCSMVIMWPSTNPHITPALPNNRICGMLIFYLWIPALVAGLQLLMVLCLGFVIL